MLHVNIWDCICQLLPFLDTVHVCPQTAMYTHLVENNIKIFQCYLGQDSLPTMLSTGWFQEKIQV